MLKNILKETRWVRFVFSSVRLSQGTTLAFVSTCTPAATGTKVMTPNFTFGKLCVCVYKIMHYIYVFLAATFPPSLCFVGNAVTLNLDALFTLLTEMLHPDSRAEIPKTSKNQKMVFQPEVIKRKSRAFLE